MTFWADVTASFVGTSTALILVLIGLWFLALPKIKEMLNPMNQMDSIFKEN